MSRRRPKTNLHTLRPAVAEDPAPSVADWPALSWETAGRLLLVVLAISLALSLLFALRLPLDANPDEGTHREYVRLLLAQHGLVRFHPGDPTHFAETHQPPLYYLLCVPVYAATRGSVFALRLVAAVLQLATICLIFRACRDLFPDRVELGLGAAAFAAFLPTQAQLAGAINNDSLTTLLCASLFWRLGLLVKQGQDLRGAAMIGVLLGIGLWTKLSVLELLPAILLAYGLAARAGMLGGRRALLCPATALVLGGLIASPWLIRNTRLYGDPLAATIYYSTGPGQPTPRIMTRLFGWTLGEYLSHTATRTFATFWYFLPPTRLTPAPGPLMLVAVLALGGLLGTLRWCYRERGEPGQRRAVGLYIAGIFLLMPFFLRFVMAVFQAQGRYFLPALLPAAIVACLGWATLAGHARLGRARFLGALGAGAVLLAMTLYAVSGGGFYP